MDFYTGKKWYMCMYNYLLEVARQQVCMSVVYKLHVVYILV